jgi:hypothetical protein
MIIDQGRTKDINLHQYTLPPHEKIGEKRRKNMRKTHSIQKNTCIQNIQYTKKKH